MGVLRKSAAIEEFIEINLPKEQLVTSVITQGRFAGGLGLEFAEHVVIKYWRPGLEGFKLFASEEGEHIFEANRDTFNEVQIRFDVPFVASKERHISVKFIAQKVVLFEIKYAGSTKFSSCHTITYFLKMYKIKFDQ